MQFKNKAEQYEWWTQAVRKIQRHDKSIRAGCREVGVQFWQYYDWKDRVQKFVDQGKVTLPLDEAQRIPRGPKTHSQSRMTQFSFVEVVDSLQESDESLTLHFKDSWRLEISEGVNPSTLSSVIKVLEAL
mgnify:CR=1 FL=1